MLPNVQQQAHAVMLARRFGPPQAQAVAVASPPVALPVEVYGAERGHGLASGDLAPGRLQPHELQHLRVAYTPGLDGVDSGRVGREVGGRVSDDAAASYPLPGEANRRGEGERQQF